MAGLLRHLPRPETRQDYRPPNYFPSLQSAKQIGLDTETYDPELTTKGPGFRRGNAYIVGVAISVGPEFSAYYPIRHADGPNCDASQVEAWLRDELENYTGGIVGANLLYDGEGLQCSGIHLRRAKWRDVQFAEALLDEHALSYSLESLAQKYLGESKRTDTLESVYGKDVKKHMNEVHPSIMEHYALQDVRLPLLILAKQRESLRQEQLTKLFDLECRLMPLLLHMRANGVRVDLEKAEQAGQILRAKRDQALHAMNKLVGFEADPASGRDLARACEVLGVSYLTTDKGNPSFPKEWIRQQTTVDRGIEQDSARDFFKHLEDARRYEKAWNPFIHNYILGSHIKGRIHAEFNPLRRTEGDNETAGTVSGRFSSSHPNLQNIPSRDEEVAPLLRGLFIPDEGWDWYSADYSQFEYRFLVHFACKARCDGAETARDMYRRDPATDFHALGSAITGVPRKHAKSINYGMSYGMGRAKTAGLLGLSLEEADELLSRYHQQMPFISELFRLASDRAQKKGFVKTIMGRRSRFDLWEPDTRDGYLVPPLPWESARRTTTGKLRRARTHKALNAIMQGSNADGIKVAMVQAWESGLVKPGGSITLALTVHDELDGNVRPTDEGRKDFERLKEIMSNVFKLEVPILVDGKIGRSWAETH